jgi:endogenous inhibitor of DNA gyrase (YacG/DUF329 family)
MSRKDMEEEAQNHEWSPDLGSILKMAGEVILAQWHEKNGIYLNAEERKERGKIPQAEVHQSDVQVRCGNQLITFVPVKEDKAMISIPVGLSDKATPATMPREKLIGYFIDALMCAFEGDATIVRYYANGVNAAINNAMEIAEDGRMKINQSKLPEFQHPIEVAEILDSFKRTYVSKSKPSTKANFTMVVQELEPVEEAPQEVEVVEPQPSKADIVMQLADNLASHSTPQEEQEVGKVLHTYTDPVHALTEADDASPHESVNEVEEVVNVAADPTPPVVEDTDDSSDETGGFAHAITTSPPVDENPHNFKKNPTDWIKHELANDELGEHMWSIEEVAGIAGCHVQTIKRALDKFEAEAAKIHMQDISTFTDEQLDEGLPGWVQLDVVIDDEYELIITCERSATGRYARGRPITFTVQGKAAEAMADSVFDSIPVEALEDAPPTLKASDDTDPSLSPCPDCGALTSHHDTPKEAPDFICGDCHLIRLDEDEQWAEESRIRAQVNAIHEGKVIDGVPVPRYADEPEEDEDEEVVEEAVEEAPSVLEEVMVSTPPLLEPPSQPFDFPPHPGVAPVPEVIDTPVAAIEGATGRCVNCAAPASFVHNTAIGERHFCTEKCWAEYTGEPVMPEGHYGLQAQHDEEVEMELEAQEEERLRAENQFDLNNAMGF